MEDDTIDSGELSGSRDAAAKVDTSDKAPIETAKPSIRESLEKAMSDSDAGRTAKKEPLPDPSADKPPQKALQDESDADEPSGQPAKKETKAKEEKPEPKAEPKAEPKEKKETKAEEPEKAEEAEDDADDDLDDENVEASPDAAESDDDEEDDDSLFKDPPSRFSQDAKQAWKEAPLPVRAEVNRALEEMSSGIEKYRHDAEAYEEFRDFHQRLQNGGQKFEDVLGHYMGMENLLAQDAVTGMRLISQNLGTSLEEIASQVLNQPLDQRTQYYVQTITQMKHGMDALRLQVQRLQQEASTAVMNEAKGELEQFVESHPRMVDAQFADEVAFFYKEKGVSLDEAYEMAERFLPDPGQYRPRAQEPGEEEQNQTAQTRKGRSLAGAPRSGSNPRSRRGPVPSTRDALRRRMSEAGL